MWWGRNVRGDRGSGALQYLALGALVALILVGLATQGIAGTIGAGVGGTICRITGGHHCASGGGAPGGASGGDGGDRPVTRRRPHVDPYKPTQACTVRQSTSTYKGNVVVASIDVGGGVTLVEQTDSRGHVTVTATDSHTAQATAGAGVGFQWGKAVDAGAGADAGAGGTLRFGDTWTFDDQEQADAFIGDVKKDRYASAAQHSGVFGADIAGYAYRHGPWAPKIPAPDSTRYEVEIHGDAGADAGADVGQGKTYKKKESGGKHRKSKGKKGKHPAGKHRATGEGGKHRATGNGGKHRAAGKSGRTGGRKGSDADIAQGRAEAHVGQKAVVTQDYKHHTYSVAVEVNFSATANGDAAAHAYQPKHPVGGSSDGAIKVTFDRHGKVIGVDLTQTVTANGTTTITTSHLPVTDANREAVTKYLAIGNRDPNVPAHLTWDDMAPTDDPGDGGTVLQREMYEHGQVSRVTYDTTSGSDPAQIDVGAGLDFGVGGSHDTEDRQVTGAEYLDAPGADGKRHYKPWKECHA